MKLSEISISYKRELPLINTAITTSQLAYKAFLRSWDKGLIEYTEEFKVIYTNRANEPLGIYHLSKGGISATLVDIKILMAIALKSAASGILIAHNHPSGNLNPSSQDLALTKKIKNACEMLDIKLLDHIILTANAYTSLADSGHI